MTSMEEYVEMGSHDAVANIVKKHGTTSPTTAIRHGEVDEEADGSWEFDYTGVAHGRVLIGAACTRENGTDRQGATASCRNNQIAYYDEASGETVRESHSPGMTPGNVGVPGRFHPAFRERAGSRSPTSRWLSAG
ncbi:MAG: hypothetical protein ACLVJ6_04310 [Merdibacter sp.]